MRVVVDTNVAISGLLWYGAPNQILKWAREDLFKVIGCNQTTAEFAQVIEYERLASRLITLEVTPAEVLAYFMNLVFHVPNPIFIPEKILEDPFDNLSLALASENKGHLIISGDRHLLTLEEFDGIQIVTPSEACRVIDTVFNL